MKKRDTIKRAPSAWRPTNIDRFILGVAYYPEHVDQSYWQRDAQRMAAAGVKVVRLGEFAWHIFEPDEECYDFAMFDTVIELLADHGIKTILCTPTATPPRWLTHRYPETLRKDETGRSASHGSRQHCDPASPIYRLHSRRITRVMSDHYVKNSNIIGWQTDNELNTSASVSYSDATLKEFQIFLRHRYKSIEELNGVWGGDFWATAYRSFDEVVLPVPSAPVAPGPGHVLDYHRFLAFATARFQAEQVGILRKKNPEWFIYHNLGRLDDIDFHGRFTADLDFLGYDIYPMLSDERLRLGSLGQTQALMLDLFRGFSGNFIIPEHQAGFGSQTAYSTMTPEPGEMRRMAFSSIARGADGLLFFRWRPAHFGVETFWMGLIDHDDVPRRRYTEAKDFFHDVTSISDEILGTYVHMDVGIANGDFDNQEAHRSYPMGLPSPFEDAVLLHGYCYKQGVSCGFVHPEDDLSRLKLYYVPHWVIWKDVWNAKIEAFVGNGGMLVVGARTGTRDTDNQVLRETAPGTFLSTLLGVHIEEFGRMAAPGATGLISAGEKTTLGNTNSQRSSEAIHRRITLTIEGNEVECGHLYERLHIDSDVETIGCWSSRFLEGEPAITLRKFGKGSVVYLGTYLTEDLVPILFSRLFNKASVTPLLSNLPDGCEVSVRVADDRQLMIIGNTTSYPVEIADVPDGDAIVLDGNWRNTQLNLDPYGTAIFLLAKALV